MCYDERLYRSWAMKAKKSDKNRSVTEPDRVQVTPIPEAPTPEPERRKEVEHELEEIL